MWSVIINIAADYMVRERVCRMIMTLYVHVRLGCRSCSDMITVEDMFYCNAYRKSDMCVAKMNCFVGTSMCGIYIFLQLGNSHSEPERRF